MSIRNRTFTRLDADTWDVLVNAAMKADDHWGVQMSNQHLGMLLGTHRRLASARAKRLVDFGMVVAIYSEVNGLPQPKVYVIQEEWLGKSPKVGDYYPVEVG